MTIQNKIDAIVNKYDTKTEGFSGIISELLSISCTLQDQKIVMQSIAIYSQNQMSFLTKQINKIVPDYAKVLTNLLKRRPDLHVQNSKSNMRGIQSDGWIYKSDDHNTRIGEWSFESYDHETKEFNENSFSAYILNIFNGL